MNEQMTNDEKTIKNGLATGALVLGILALITTLFFINYLLGLIGFILAIVYLIKKGEKRAKGRAIAGLICALLSIILSTALWIGVYTYLTTSSVSTLMDDINKFTNGQVSAEQIVDETISANIQNKAEIERVLGKELNYDTICKFVGEEVTIETITNFIGDGIDSNEIKTLMEEIDYSAVVNDLGGEFTYKALEEKIGEDFTYEELKQYLERFQ